ncbi:hypothetical protein G6F35_016120 [Rhizopus arrhizus]|nr:hypothetical protein G6F35_016120 [Rhizopus arrhizus]
MARDFRAAGNDRRRRVRVRQRHRDLVQLVELRVAPQLGRRQLQHARLHRHAHGRHRDAVLVREVGNGLHIGVIRDEVIRKVAQRCHAFHVLLAVRAVPDRQQRSDARPRDIHSPRQQRIVHGRSTGQLGPLDRDIHTFGLAVFFDQLLVARHVQQQVNDAVLFRDADAPFGQGGRGRRQRQHPQNQRQGGAGNGLDQSVP